jgi:hypothetical protein
MAVIVGGFIFGVMSSIVFLPYITFGKWDAVRSMALQCCIRVKDW